MTTFNQTPVTFSEFKKRAALTNSEDVLTDLGLCNPIQCLHYGEGLFIEVAEEDNGHILNIGNQEWWTGDEGESLETLEHRLYDFAITEGYFGLDIADVVNSYGYTPVNCDVVLDGVFFDALEDKTDPDFPGPMRVEITLERNADGKIEDHNMSGSVPLS